MSILAKRMMSELHEANKINIENDGYGGVYLIQANEDSILQLKALIIGPSDSVYEGGFFLFDITIPETFPINPPKFKFISPEYYNGVRIHPNLYGCGKVCLSIINTWGGPEWSPVTRNVAVLHTIQSLLDEDPINHEPGTFCNSQHTNYIKAIKYMNIVMAYYIYKSKDQLHPFLREKVEYFFNKYRDTYIKTLLTMTDGKVKYYHGTVNIYVSAMVNNISSA